MALIKNQEQKVRQWFDDNINKFGIDLGNNLYFIYDNKYDLFLERIREDVSKDYEKIKNSSTKIIDMGITKKRPDNDDQAPKWFEKWNKETYQTQPPKWFEKWNEEVYQTQPPKWFESWNNETFKPFQDEVRKDIKNIYSILERNKIK